MENDNDLQADIPELAELPVVADGQKDTTDWKAIAQERQEALAKMQGMTKRFQTKLKKLSEAPKATEAPKPSSQPEKKGFDYAEKAYLKSEGIDKAEFDFVQEAMQSSGKTLDQVLESKWFVAELKERKDLRMTEQATPSGTKRAGQTTRDQVDYWIAKGELPPADQWQLRRDVVNARLKQETNKSHFTDNPIAGK